MTRQRLTQLAHMAAGLCCSCHRPLHEGSKAFCYYHLLKRRVLMRKRRGCKPGHKTGMGRKAIPRNPQPELDPTRLVFRVCAMDIPPSDLSK